MFFSVAVDFSDARGEAIGVGKGFSLCGERLTIVGRPRGCDGGPSASSKWARLALGRRLVTALAVRPIIISLLLSLLGSAAL